MPELTETVVEEKIDEATYIIMKHHIAMESYEDLATIFPALPRSHKIYIAIKLASTINPGLLNIGEREKK